MAKLTKPLILLGNNVSSAVKSALGGDSNLPVPASIGEFGSGEPFVELFRGEEANFAANSAKLRGTEAYAVQSGDEPVGAHCQHLLLMAHTLKHYGVKEVTAVLPFAPFDRQDREFKDRFVSLAAELFPAQLKAAGVDRVISITPHSQSAMKFYQQEFGTRYTALSANPLFAADIKKRLGGDMGSIAIGAPDGADKPLDAGQARARELSEAVFGDDYQNAMFKIAKTHTGVSQTKITSFEGDVKGKACVIVDDMIDGGSTMINAATLLKERGAASVTVYATHAILSDEALEKILSAPGKDGTPAIDTLVVTDTIPSVVQKIATLAQTKPELAGRAEVLSTGPMIAAEVARQHLQEAGFVDDLRRDARRLG